MNSALLTVIAWLLHPIGAAESAAADAPPPVAIEIGNLVSPISAVDWLQNELSAFAAAHPDVQVTATSFLEPNRSKFPLAQNAPLPRNVVGIASQFGYEATYLAAKGVIVPIDEFLPDPEFSWDLFYDAYWDAVAYDGKRWGVPWAAFTQLLLCDQTLFEAAGVACPPQTWDELLNAAQRLTLDSDNDGIPEQWGLRVSTSDDSISNIFLSMILQKGGKIIDNDRFALSLPMVKECGEYLTQLVLKSNAAKMDNRPLETVLADKAAKYAMHLVSTRSLGAVPREPNLLLAPLPSSGPPVTYCPSRLYLCVLRTTPEEEKASWTLVKWLSRPDISIPHLLQGYPCRKDFTRRPEFAAAVAGCCKGVENIYLATENGADSGGHVIGCTQGAQALWRGILPALRGLQPFESVFDEAIKAANAELTPLPVTSADPAFYK